LFFKPEKVSSDFCFLRPLRLERLKGAGGAKGFAFFVCLEFEI
jgi:hypothetical protein